MHFLHSPDFVLHKPFEVFKFVEPIIDTLLNNVRSKENKSYHQIAPMNKSHPKQALAVPAPNMTFNDSRLPAPFFPIHTPTALNEASLVPLTSAMPQHIFEPET